VPFWIAPVFGLLAAVTVPWTAYLAVVLPGHADAPNYRSAWVGFDIGLVLALSATAYLAWRGRRQVALAATATATLLVVDAWFDVLTAGPACDLLAAVALAILVELPLAGLSLWLALHTERLVARRLRQLARRAARRSARQSAWAGRESRAADGPG
jgi:hypothetical protein